jgi:hypothetical protein
VDKEEGSDGSNLALIILHGVVAGFSAISILKDLSPGGVMKDGPFRVTHNKFVPALI